MVQPAGIVITIDGPAGSGKSTAARKVARTLGLIHLNSGALFRAVGLVARRQGVALDDEMAVAAVAGGMRFSCEVTGSGETKLRVDGADVSEEIRTLEAAQGASAVAKLPAVRAVLDDVQRGIAKQGSVVCEGRDSGTVVFPDAAVKFFLDADLEERAKRRRAELLESASGENAPSLDEVMSRMRERDHADSTREIAPQKAADDATIVDTTSLSAEEVEAVLLEKIRPLLPS